MRRYYKSGGKVKLVVKSARKVRRGLSVLLIPTRLLMQTWQLLSIAKILITPRAVRKRRSMAKDPKVGTGKSQRVDRRLYTDENLKIRCL